MPFKARSAPRLPLRDGGERVSAATLDALPPGGVKWEHGVPSVNVRERLFPDTPGSVGGCGDVFDGDVDVGELGAGQRGDVAVDDRAYCADEGLDRWSVGDDEAD
jgi:hypothetical protein